MINYEFITTERIHVCLHIRFIIHLFLLFIRIYTAYTVKYVAIYFWAKPGSYCNTCTVRPQLSGHVGTGTYRDKWFGRIWEICFKNTASSVGLNTCYNVFTHCFCICNCKLSFIEWISNEIKQKFNYFVFVFSKILVENRQYTLQDCGRMIEISDNWGPTVPHLHTMSYKILHQDNHYTMNRGLLHKELWSIESMLKDIA